MALLLGGGGQGWRLSQPWASGDFFFWERKEDRKEGKKERRQQKKADRRKKEKEKKKEEDRDTFTGRPFTEQLCHTPESLTTNSSSYFQGTLKIHIVSFLNIYVSLILQFGKEVVSH